MSGGKVLAVIAGGGALYLLYQALSEKQAAGTPAAAGSSSLPAWGAGAPAPVIVPTVPAAAGAPPVDAAAVAGAAAMAGYPAGSLLNWHQWNYFGRALDAGALWPAPEAAGAGDGSARIPVQEWWAGVLRVRGGANAA